MAKSYLQRVDPEFTELVNEIAKNIQTQWGLDDKGNKKGGRKVVSFQNVTKYLARKIKKQNKVNFEL